MTSLSLTSVTSAVIIAATAVFGSPVAALAVTQSSEKPHVKPWDPSIDSVTKDSTGWGYFVRVRPQWGGPLGVQPVRESYPSQESSFERLAFTIDEFLDTRVAQQH